MDEPDFTITLVRIKEMAEKYIVLGWQTVSAGYGEITFVYADAGLALVDDEHMGEAFVRRAARFFVREVFAGREPQMQIYARDEATTVDMFDIAFAHAIDRYYARQHRGSA